MKNLKLRKKIYDYTTLKKWQIIKTRYPDIQKIFGISNNALDYEISDLSSKRLKSMHKFYMKDCKEIENSYHYILNETAKLIHNITEIYNILDITYIYDYILFNGYLSINNDFNFTMPKYELELRKGFSIFSGEGVCRNIADLLSDILSYLDIETTGIITYRNQENSSIITLTKDYDYLINKDLDKFSIEYDEHLSLNQIEEKELLTGNHFEILTLDNSHIIDPTIGIIYKITDKKTNYPIMDNIRLWYLLASGEYNIKDIIKLYNSLKDKYLLPYKQKEVIKAQKESFIKCENNKQKILEFRNNIYEDMSYINNALHTIKSE